MKRKLLFVVILMLLLSAWTPVSAEVCPPGGTDAAHPGLICIQGSPWYVVSGRAQSHARVAPAVEPYSGRVRVFCPEGGHCDDPVVMFGGDEDSHRFRPPVDWPYPVFTEEAYP